MEYASIRRRAAAHLIDCLLLGVVFVVIGIWIDRQRDLFGWLRDTLEPRQSTVLVQQQVVLLVVLLLLNYFPLMWIWCEATLGKMALGLKVKRADGGHITTGRAYVRVLLMVLSQLVLMLGYVGSFQNEQRQALHDVIAGTVVVRAAGPG